MAEKAAEEGDEIESKKPAEGKYADNSSSDDDSDDDGVQTKQFKVILLGDGAVGKTSIATRFCKDDFSVSYRQLGLIFSSGRSPCRTTSRYASKFGISEDKALAER